MKTNPQLTDPNIRRALAERKLVWRNIGTCYLISGNMRGFRIAYRVGRSLQPRGRMMR